MDIEEAAAHLGVSSKTLRRWIKEGRIQARLVKDGPKKPKLDFSPQDLEEAKRELLHPQVVTNEENLDVNGHDLPAILPDVQIPALPKVLDGVGNVLEAFARKLDTIGTADPMLSKFPPLLTVEQVAECLQASPSKVKEFLREGKLRGVKGIAKGWRIRKEDLKRFVDGL